MSQHYRIDRFGTPLTSARIFDVRDAPSGSSTMMGNFVVRVPDWLSIQNPTDVGDLLTKKHAAMLAYYAGMTQIAYDDLLDATGLDLAAPNTQGVFGERSTIWVASTKLVQSTMVALALAPVQCVVTWDVHTVGLSDPALGRVTQTYQEVDSDSTSTCQVSFNNGLTWTAALNGQLLNVALPDQGNQFLIQITNTSGGPLHLDSWALVY